MESKEIKSKEESVEKGELESPSNNYVFICFPPGGDENEQKRLLKKIEDFFPNHEFVFGDLSIWKRQAQSLLDVGKAVQLSDLVNQPENKERALKTANFIKECLDIYYEKNKIPQPETYYFFYWELKKAMIGSGKFKKISNKEVKELINYLLIFEFIQEFKVENNSSSRYCLTISKENSEDLFQTQILEYDERVNQLMKEREEFVKRQKAIAELK